MRVGGDGWLQPERGGAPVVQLPSVRTSPLVPSGALAVVWHATGGVGGPRFAEGLARRIQTYRRGVDRPASWHVLISATGTLFQNAPFSVGTWHVGRPGVIAGMRHPSVNAVTIGVELENAGPLVQVQGAFYAWPYWLDRSTRKPDPRCRIAPTRVTRHAGRAYDAFTAAQLASARELIQSLARDRGWGPDAFRYCHSDFAAPAKTDPGPLWTATLPALLEAAFDVAPPAADGEQDITIVTGPPVFDPEHRFADAAAADSSQLETA